MNVRYSNNVKLAIQQYAQSLSVYPISKERKKQKIRTLRNFLRNSISMVSNTIGITSYALCTFSDLGQTFDDNHKPLNKSLRQTHFSDKSGTQWMVSFILLEDGNTIYIHSLKQTINVVKEALLISNKQLYRIIRESIKKVIIEKQSAILTKAPCTMM